MSDARGKSTGAADGRISGTTADLPRALGVNHVALEVRDLNEELAFLASLFRFDLRSRDNEHAFIELGDQFIALFVADSTRRDKHRHFGLVVDDKDALRTRLESQGVEIPSERFLEFRDPSGNLWQVVEYGNVEYLKDPSALASLGARSTIKSADAIAALEKKGIYPA